MWPMLARPSASSWKRSTTRNGCTRLSATCRQPGSKQIKRMPLRGTFPYEFFKASGNLSIRWRRRLDGPRAAAGIAWRRQRVPALAGDLERAPLRAGSFAGLTMFHVMEHLYDPRAYLAAARELLAPDGRLVVQAPNAASWQARLLGRAWNGADIPRHLTDFRGGDLEKMVESAGFEVLRRKYFSLRDNPAGLASSLAPSLDPMARRVRRVAESGGARLAKDLT